MGSRIAKIRKSTKCRYFFRQPEVGYTMKFINPNTQAEHVLKVWDYKTEQVTLADDDSKFFYCDVIKYTITPEISSEEFRMFGCGKRKLHLWNDRVESNSGLVTVVSKKMMKLTLNDGREADCHVAYSALSADYNKDIVWRLDFITEE